MNTEKENNIIYIIKDFICPICNAEFICMMPITGRGWECEECGFYDNCYLWIPYSLNYDKVVTDVDERHLIASSIVYRNSKNL